MSVNGMIYRRIVPRKYGSQWYVNIPLDLRCTDPRKRRQFDNAKDAADFARQLNEARRTNLQFFFAMHPAVLSEIAFRTQEIGAENALAALRRANEALAKSSRTAAEVYAEYMATKKTEVRKNSYATIKSAIAPLVDKPRPIADISPEDVAAHIAGLHYTPEGVRSALAPIKAFFNWCVLHEIIDRSPAAKIKRPTVTRTEIKILSIADCRLLLDAAKEHAPKIIPFIALQLFGGLRAAEAERVRAEDIKNGYVVIIGAQTKLNTRRAVPISDQLKSWLAVPGAEIGVPDVREKLYQLRLKCGVPIPKNALRHSFCSYLYAAGTDIDAVAKAAGNSAEMLKRHYLGLASKQDGEAFAKILP